MKRLLSDRYPMGGSYGCGTMWNGKAWYQAELFNSTLHTPHSTLTIVCRRKR
ncbi:MAG: hypothetical protein VZR73_04200 [Acutalibacteraceae bacterium]|nr:hypothetical protein [Acutalibacteraceae bacterium]